ncbi:MAG: hypothetical protein ACRCYY_17110 [Trueperaceae bacterium]
MSNTQQQPSWLSSMTDFAFLQGQDDYAQYFNILTKTWGLMQGLYEGRGSGDTFEARAIKQSLERLLFTVKVLRMKYSHSPAHRRMLWVDLSESGFPNAQDVGNLGVDFMKRDTRLRDLPPETQLKQRALDHMMKLHTEPEDLLWQLSERSYLDMLEDNKLFLLFNMVADDLAIRPSKNKRTLRSYSCTWSCYDFRTNRPYIHLLTFDQDKGERPLEKAGPNQLKFLEVIQAEGSRVPDVGVLAVAIDHALEGIHPKILKRICLGPLYTSLLLKQELKQMEDNPEAMLKPRVLLELLGQYGEDDDIILCFTEEIVFSKQQRITKTSHVREVFYLPDTDPEAYARRASVVHTYVLMPHSVAQHLIDDILLHVPELQHAQILTYGRNGEIYNQPPSA